MTELVKLTNGKNAWETAEVSGIRSFRFADGSCGLRFEEDVNGVNVTKPATAFPCSALLACSFDRELVKEVAAAIADETKAAGVDVLLAPGLSVKKSPLCGRNFEYFSEDPYLVGEMGAAFVRGLQENGVGACIKHFVLNEQETARVSSDSICDERAKREIYFYPFEYVIKNAKPYFLMTSYNKVDGIYTAQNKRLLTDILRNEWGYDGITISDWGGTKDPVASVLSGLDTAMPGGGKYYVKEVSKAVKRGIIPAEKLLSIAERYKQLAEKLPEQPKIPADFDKNHRIAVKAAEQSMVLLKNEDNVLPFKGESIAVIGAAAETPHYQGGGAANVVPTRKVSIKDFLPEYCRFAGGYTFSVSDTDENLIAEAVELAKSCEKAVIFTSYGFLGESEGYDREDLSLPENQNELIRAVSAANPNTVVVLMSGRAVEMPWLENVKSVLFAGLAGQALGEAACNILFGRVSPGGKLSETFPLSVNDVPSADTFGGEHLVEYAESVFVGYRYYDAAKKNVLFPFGHGLAYTSFDYSDLKVAEGKASFTVMNTGNFAAHEIAQVYISRPENDIEKELCGFEKVFLNPGESTRITVDVPGEGRILVGASSKDIRLYDCAEKDLRRPDTQRNPPGAPACIASPRSAPYTDESTLKDISHTALGKFLNNLVTKQFNSSPVTEQNGYDQRYMLSRIAPHLPLFALTAATDGFIGKRTLKVILFFLNLLGKDSKHEKTS